jgi:hypothetical protein
VHSCAGTSLCPRRLHSTRVTRFNRVSFRHVVGTRPDPETGRRPFVLLSLALQGTGNDRACTAAGHPVTRVLRMPGHGQALRAYVLRVNSRTRYESAADS